MTITLIAILLIYNNLIAFMLPVSYCRFTNPYLYLIYIEDNRDYALHNINIALYYCIHVAYRIYAQLYLYLL